MMKERVATRMSTTESVLDHHLETFGALDAEGIMEDYADDAVVITEEEVFRGVEAIREGFFEEGLFPDFDDPDATFSLNTQVVEGDYAYIVWRAETSNTTYEFATDTFVIRDGEIVSQTFAAETSAND